MIKIKKKQMFTFIKAAFAAVENTQRGIDVKFQCPICGGEAHAEKARCNGHIYAHCLKCAAEFVQ